MRRNVRKWICCLGVVAIMFMADTKAVHAETYNCDPWKIINKNYECRTPICDGKRRTGYLTVVRQRKCTYSDTGYTFTIPDTYVEEQGCCELDS